MNEYQGMNRHILKPPDYLNYARIYIRADTRRTDIKRKYQKLMEFYADISSMVITVYRILIIFFNFVNKAARFSFRAAARLPAFR